jgi:hypothetical protein
VGENVTSWAHLIIHDDKNDAEEGALLIDAHSSPPGEVSSS